MHNLEEVIGNNTKTKSRPAHYFFVWMASIFITLTLIGFGLDYLMITNTEGVKVHWFALIHGLVMGSWLLLMLTQTILAAKGNFKFHQQLGFISIGLAALVWLTMCIVSIRPIITYSPPVDAQDGSWDIMLINLFAISLFPLFFVWGILLRKKATMHKRLLLFTTVVCLQAAVDRIRFLPGLDAAPFVHFVYLDVLLIAPLFIYDFTTIKRIHKATITGAMIIMVVQIAMTMTWGTSAWHKFCFERFAPFTEKVTEVKLSDTQIRPLLGDYGDKNWHVTVSQEGGKLYLKLPDTPKYEMGATSENEWFLRTMTWKTSFIRGKDGSVMKLINKQPNLTWELKRLR